MRKLLALCCLLAACGNPSPSLLDPLSLDFRLLARQGENAIFVETTSLQRHEDGFQLIYFVESLDDSAEQNANIFYQGILSCDRGDPSFAPLAEKAPGGEWERRNDKPFGVTQAWCDRVAQYLKP